jgi:competence protein ComEC
MPYKITILDVGHGNSAVVSLPDWVAVIDAGPGAALLSFLRAQGIDTIDDVLISHADEDHIGGLIALLAAGTCRVKRVRLNTDSRKDSNIWNDLLVALDRAQRKGALDYLPSLTVAQNGEFDHQPIRIEILGPSTYLASRGPGSTDRWGRPITTNSIGAVIRVSVDSQRLVLFADDIDQIGLDELLYEETTDPRAEVLVFPHHGGRAGTSSTTQFSEAITLAVKPSCVVFSIGRGRHATPLPEVVATVRASAPGVRIACTQLSDRCAALLPTSRPTHLNAVFARGQERNQCCAGTMITANAPTALCR